MPAKARALARIRSRHALSWLARTALAASVLSFGRVSPADAQEKRPPLFEPNRMVAPAGNAVLLQMPATETSTGALVFAGLMGGGIGFVGGIYAGYGIEHALSDCEGEELCGLGGALLGAVLGEAIGLPMGVHLANGSVGNYGQQALASMGIAAVGALVGFGLGGPVAPVILVAVPIVQLAISISIERRTAIQ
jgi:hypothetical protein